MILENYVAIDLEMTGLNTKRDKILEIGAVRVKNKKIEDTYQALIDPHLELPEEIVELTGITNEMACGGREIDQVMPEIVAFCGDFVLLGHNIIFDYGFLKQAARNCDLEFEHRGMDTLKLARKLLPPEEKKTLQTLCDRFGIARERRHRALDDAKAAGELYEILETAYEARQPEVFQPYPLVYKVKKLQPATKRQKIHLKGLAEYHQLELSVSWETLTKNEASRQIDKIIAQHGRMPKQENKLEMVSNLSESADKRIQE